MYCTLLTCSLAVSEQAMDNAQQLAPLVRLLLRTLFVTFLSLDTLLYIMDHFLMASDAPDFQVSFHAFMFITV